MKNIKTTLKNIFITLTFLIFMSTLIIANDLNLMPYPKSVQLLNGKYRIDEKFNIEFNLETSRIKKSSFQFLNRLSKRTGLFLINPFPNSSNNPSGNGLKIFIEAEGTVELGMNESYSIEVGDSVIIIRAVNDIGAIRALETMQQLLTADAFGFYFPRLKIEDSPRFPWRGLMIDVCRHFMPMEVLKRNIDGMAAVKMNVFHWHLSEDQGFRVESKTYPKLTELGSDGLFYTHEQVEEIIKYADERGIRVVPEFDVPGHATAILTAYPNLASAPGPYKIERGWGVFDPTLNPIKDETYIFLRNLFTEMAELFPDEYFHIGGDENNGKQWNENQEIQEFMKLNQIEDNHALQGYFNNKLLTILTNLDKKMIGWDEIFHPSMPNNIVIQSWRGKDALIESAKKGYQTILSNGYYIDLMQPTDFHYLNDPIAADAELNDDEKKMILGGEATMWAELVSDENIDSRIWPRTAAIAERFWSPQDINDISEMYRRLGFISNLLEEYGLAHIK
ncbi:MAG: family 20 glycosylhydrolase, partial [Melioribacteraceae bacterium]|nr:family 20 glycosylhydrolase [Melioribacteraceae bacterium]